MSPDLTLVQAVESLAGALLIGLLVGSQREASGAVTGLRDFLLISLVAGVASVLENPWLGGASLLSVTLVLAVLHFEGREKRSGVTTECSAIATFSLAYLAASPEIKIGAPLAIGTTILTIMFLEAKHRMRTLARETITESEFNATLAFVAVVLVIYPLLPVGRFGPFHFFDPRQVWLFVILVSTLSFAGYFLEKFLGDEKGLLYTSILGGLASTTAATLHFARQSKEKPEELEGLWRASMIANTVQFPRTALIVALVSPPLALACLWPLAAMTLGGIAFAAALSRHPHQSPVAVQVRSGNPFRIRPALEFGALFTLIVFISRAAAAKAGGSALYATSLLGGLVDVATVVAPAADLLQGARISLGLAEASVLIALASNIALKVVVAMAGSRAYAVRMTVSFVALIALGGAVWFAAARFGLS